MVPAEKYMNIDGNKEENFSLSRDMKFTPFKGNQSSVANNSKNMIIGWMPIYLYPNMNGMPNMSSMSNQESNMNSSMQNNNFNPNEFPDETAENMLYSYNNSQSNTDTSNSSNNANQQRELLQVSPDNSENYNKMMEILKEYNIDLEEDTDLARNLNEDVDEIYKEFENENPGTFSLLKTYNVPYPIIKMTIKRIIKISLKNCNKEGE